jgi:hypothetical protein
VFVRRPGQNNLFKTESFQNTFAELKNVHNIYLYILRFLTGVLQPKKAHLKPAMRSSALARIASRERRSVKLPNSYKLRRLVVYDPRTNFLYNFLADSVILFFRALSRHVCCDFVNISGSSSYQVQQAACGSEARENSGHR